MLEIFQKNEKNTFKNSKQCFNLVVALSSNNPRLIIKHQRLSACLANDEHKQVGDEGFDPSRVGLYFSLFRFGGGISTSGSYIPRSFFSDFFTVS